jgi:hypothetical protein
MDSLSISEKLTMLRAVVEITDNGLQIFSIAESDRETKLFFDALRREFAVTTFSKQ